MFSTKHCVEKCNKKDSSSFSFKRHNGPILTHFCPMTLVISSVHVTFCGCQRQRLLKQNLSLWTNLCNGKYRLPCSFDSIYFGIELSLREVLSVVYMHALLHALMTLISCAVETIMRYRGITLRDFSFLVEANQTTVWDFLLIFSLICLVITDDRQMRIWNSDLEMGSMPCVCLWVVLRALMQTTAGSYSWYFDSKIWTSPSLFLSNTTLMYWESVNADGLVLGGWRYKPAKCCCTQ